jgi:hypothetical protein
MDVVLVRWPDEARTLDSARRRGQARLLLVEGGHSPPTVQDELEDWIRVPAPEADVCARVAALQHRAAARRRELPTLEGGVLRHRSGWVTLPPVEARLAEALLERFGAVVSRERLARAGWPDGLPGRNALDVHVLRLRRRIAPLGLVMRTVRSRGYLLECAETAGVPDAGAANGAASLSGASQG